MMWRFKRKHPAEYEDMLAKIRQSICASRVMMNDSYYQEKGNWHKDDRSCCKQDGKKELKP
jgi:hypothetical protein